MRALGRLFVLWLLLFPVACDSSGGGGGDGGDGDGATVPKAVSDPAKAVANYARAFCDSLSQCFWRDDDSAITGPIVADSCEQLVVRSVGGPGFDDLLVLIETGDVTYDPEKFAQCLSVIGSACINAAYYPDICNGVFDGTLEPGAECRRSEQCKGDAGCKTGFGNCPGICVPRKAIGDKCDLDSECTQEVPAGADFVTCAATADQGNVCVAVTLVLDAAAGDACGEGEVASGTRTDVICGDDLYCEAQEEMCRPAPKENEPCSEVCAPNLGCSEGKCVAFSIADKAGDTCGQANLTVCDPLKRLRCSDGTNGTCQTFTDGKAGSSCDLTDLLDPDLLCDTGLVCDRTTKRCVQPKADGETCAADIECASGSCDESTIRCASQYCGAPFLAE